MFYWLSASGKRALSFWKSEDCFLMHLQKTLQQRWKKGLWLVPLQLWVIQEIQKSEPSHLDTRPTNATRVVNGLMLIPMCNGVGWTLWKGHGWNCEDVQWNKGCQWCLLCSGCQLKSQSFFSQAILHAAFWAYLRSFQDRHVLFPNIVCHHFPFYTRWWFQIFFIFTPIWGRFPIWLIFFKGVETTN